jgi:hypothetical protein
MPEVVTIVFDMRHSSPTTPIAADAAAFICEISSLPAVGVLHTIVTAVSWVLRGRDRTLIPWDTSDDFGVPSR